MRVPRAAPRWATSRAGQSLTKCFYFLYSSNNCCCHRRRCSDIGATGQKGHGCHPGQATFQAGNWDRSYFSLLAFLFSELLRTRPRVLYANRSTIFRNSSYIVPERRRRVSRRSGVQSARPAPADAVGGLHRRGGPQRPPEAPLQGARPPCFGARF